MKKKTIVIAGGGTGGHIYPGLAIAEFLKSHDPQAQVHFVGAQGGLEQKIVPRNGYPLHCLPVGRLHQSVSLWRRFKALLLLPFAFISAVFLYLRLRPQWVLGVGGFASGPFVFVAQLLGGRTAILEPNAYPGLANRWLSKWVDHCFVVFEKAGEFFPTHKVEVVGLPVRIPKAVESSDFEQPPLKILIFGGSQGARAINEVVGQWIENLPSDDSSIEVLHQIGHRDFAIWNQKYADHDKRFFNFVEYIHDMPEKLKWADLVICRSGVGSVAEVAMANRPAIFIPLPTAADNHQLKNAQVLCEQGGALLIEQKDLTWQKLDQVISDLKSHPEKLNNMASRLKDIDYSQAPQQIVLKMQEKA